MKTHAARTVAAALLAHGLLATGTAKAAGTACHLDRRASGAPPPHVRSGSFSTARVLLYGDSITYQSWKMLTPSIPSLAVDAWWGRATGPTLSVMAADYRARRAHAPAVVVMAVGTNDVANPSRMSDYVRQARALLPSSVRLIWANAYLETTDRWNLVDRAISSVRGIQTARWSSVNLSYRKNRPSSGLLQDGVHVNCKGAAVRTDLLHQAIRG